MEVGRSVAMVDAYSRVTGTTDFAATIELPGLLVGRILPSPHPHARVVHVDTSEAEKVPGVAAVLSRNDLVNNPQFSPAFGPIIRDRSPVAVDKVRFVGDLVAAVAAETSASAEEALELVEVEYERLPAVFDPEEALEAGAPLVHDGPRDVIAGRPDVRERSVEGTNIVNLFTQRKGDTHTGFEQCDVIVENSYHSPAVAHVPMETHHCVAKVTNDQIIVWSSTQSPFLVQQAVARVLRVPLSRVRVIVPQVGGGFGNKMNANLEPTAALLSWKAGKPVRFALRREESLLVSTQHAATIRVKTGATSDGILMAQEATCYYNCGPYAGSSPNLITRAYAATGPYLVPHVSADSYGVYTNAIPAGPFRGYGITQVAWPHEAQMDILADELDMDPVELRSRNLLKAGDPFTTGEPFPECHFDELLAEAAERVDWNNGPLVTHDNGSIRAKGVACIVKGGAATPSTAAVKLNADTPASLNVLVGSVEMGQGAQTVLAQIAADVIGLPLANVMVSGPDTLTTPYDSMTAASRTTFTMGTAVRFAVEDVKKQLAKLAASLLEASVEDLVLQDGRVFVIDTPESSMDYGEVIRRAGRGDLVGEGFFGPKAGLDPDTGQGKGSVQWHPGVASCEIEIDTETGYYRVIRLHAGVYVGKMINPRLCELQVEGSMLFGLGQATFEEVVLDTDGRLTNANLSDYMIPSFLDLPDQMSIQILESSDATEVHGIGETAVPPIRPAIANAISRATGTRVQRLPITPERVLELLVAHRTSDERIKEATAFGPSARTL